MRALFLFFASAMVVALTGYDPVRIKRFDAIVRETTTEVYA